MTTSQESCALFDSQQCDSCSLLSITNSIQRSDTKLSRLTELLTKNQLSVGSLEPLFTPTSPWRSRHKVKYLLSGNSESPTFGFVRNLVASSDLTDCPLSHQRIPPLLETLKDKISEERIPLYNLKDQSGELKGVIVMINGDGSEGILRFIVKSASITNALQSIIPEIQLAHPWIKVVSYNLQSLPAAILEGPEEKFLTTQTFIRDHYGKIQVAFSPQSFMQVTHQSATALYTRAAEIIATGEYSSVLDLYCGVGGFSFAAAQSAKRIHGVEISAEAVQCARKATEWNKALSCSFEVVDADSSAIFPHIKDYDLIIVNPPRRGLSKELLTHLCSDAKAVLYSSCNPETLCRDLLTLKECFAVKVIAPFDMFPLTHHLEVLVELVGKSI